jgi:hypothetical protein
MTVNKEELYTVIVADEGKVLARKDDSTKIIGKKIILSVIDSADNYIEVDEPKEEEKQEVRGVKKLRSYKELKVCDGEIKKPPFVCKRLYPFTTFKVSKHH